MRLHRIALLCLCALASSVLPQTTARYRPLLENNYVSVFGLDLRPRYQAPLYQNTHDLFWIALDESRVTFVATDGARREVQFRPGDTRLFRSYQMKSVWNTSGAGFRAVLVQLKQRRLVNNGCFCTDDIESAVCGCAPAVHLPAMWATGVGKIMLGGTTLAPRQSYERVAHRGNMLLVAVTAVHLRDEAADSGNPSAINLQPGGVVWLNPGWHKFINVGSEAARFVSFEL